MPMPVTTNDFLELVRKSGVVDEKRLDSHIEKLRADDSLPREPGKMAGILVRDGLLTHFQAEQILQGKWRRFTIGKYKVLEPLGAGGMGRVYLCEHKLMRRRVAVKVLPAAKASDPSALERFYREARAVAALDHPNIVHAYDIDQDDNLHFLVMEYVDGSSLQDIVKKKGPLNPVRAAHYIRQAAEGLEHAHSAGLVHRDIKPGNILVDRTGVVKILDMGLARFFHDEEDILTKKFDENVLGTADYLAPEQAIDSHTVDIRADIYSLGATFYFLLAGKTPFGEGTVAQKLIWHQTRPPKPLTGFRSDVPPEMIAVIEKMMAKKPEDRYQSPAEVYAALAPWTVTPVPPPSESEMPKVISPSVSPLEATVVTSGTPVPATAPSVTGIANAGPSSDLPIPAPSSPPPSPRTARGASVPARTLEMPAPAAMPTQDDMGAVPEEIGWDKLTSDTVDANARVDTDRPLTPTLRKGAARAQVTDRRRMWGIAIGVTVVALLALSVGFIKYFSRSVPPPVVRPHLQVTGAHTGTYAFPIFRTVENALRQARPGDVIDLLDEEHDENLTVRGHMPVTVQAAPGKKVVWRSTKKGRKEDVLLYLYNAKDFTLKGITFDGTLKGSERLDTLVMVTFNSAGLSLQDVNFRSFSHSAVKVVNCAGEAGAPVRFANLRAEASASPPPKAVVFFDARSDARPPVNDFIEVDVDPGSFPGFAPQNIIKLANEHVIGSHVRLPKLP
jgi:serine/threonine protein kinase